LRSIIGPKEDSVTGEWRRLHNEELCDLYSSPHVIQVISFRRMRWDGAYDTYGDRRGAYRVLVAILKGKRTLRRPKCRCRIIVRWIFRKCDVGAWTGFISGLVQ